MELQKNLLDYDKISRNWSSYLVYSLHIMSFTCFRVNILQLGIIITNIFKNSELHGRNLALQIYSYFVGGVMKSSVGNVVQWSNSLFSHFR